MRFILFVTDTLLLGKDPFSLAPLIVVISKLPGQKLSVDDFWNFQVEHTSS